MSKMMNTLVENVNATSFDFSSLRMSQKTYDCIRNGYKIKETFPSASKTKLKHIKNNALVLYEFLLRRVRKQNNFILWANEKFVCCGTDLSPKSYQKAKKYLKSLNLVAKFEQNRTPDGQFSERAYIRVNYLVEDSEDDLFSYLDSLSSDDLKLVFLGLEPSSHFSAKVVNDGRKKIQKKKEIPSDFLSERRVYEDQTKVCNPTTQTGKAKLKYNTKTTEKIPKQIKTEPEKEKKGKVEVETGKKKVEAKTEQKKDNRWWRQSAKEQQETFGNLSIELQKNALQLADYSKTVLDYDFLSHDYHFFLQLAFRLKKFTFREMIFVILGESCRSKKSRDLPKVLNNPEWTKERLNYSNDPEKSKWIEARTKIFPIPLEYKTNSTNDNHLAKKKVSFLEKKELQQSYKEKKLSLEPKMKMLQEVELFCDHPIGCGIEKQVEVFEVECKDEIVQRKQKAKRRFSGIAQQLTENVESSGKNLKKYSY
ncbi:MAG: hypothetical protein ACI86H_002186 [bacterium]|jgi:hypothetical protein